MSTKRKTTEAASGEAVKILTMPEGETILIKTQAGCEELLEECERLFNDAMAAAPEAQRRAIIKHFKENCPQRDDTHLAALPIWYAGPDERFPGLVDGPGFEHEGIRVDPSLDPNDPFSLSGSFKFWLTEIPMHASWGVHDLICHDEIYGYANGIDFLEYWKTGEAPAGLVELNRLLDEAEAMLKEIRSTYFLTD